MPPVIYFGAPKTSTTFLYYAFCACGNYQQTAVKEWTYLLPLDRCGPLRYAQRHGDLFGGEAYKNYWSSIYWSYSEHIRYFANNPSSDYARTQLVHTQKLIFDDHSIENYLQLFNIDKRRFFVDFTPGNHLISQALLKSLINQAPDAVFLVGIRPFFSHVLSLIHEHFVWCAEHKTDSMENAIDATSINQIDYDRFLPLALGAISKAKKFYAICADSDDGLQTKLEMSSSGCSETESAVSDSGIFGSTNVFRIVSKLSTETDRVIYYNSTLAPKKIDYVLGELSKKGIDIGTVSPSLYQDRIRGSERIVADKLFEAPEIRTEIKDLCRKAECYFASRLDAMTCRILFPLVNYDNRFFEEARRVDEDNLVNDVILHPTPVLTVK